MDPNNNQPPRPQQGPMPGPPPPMPGSTPDWQQGLGQPLPPPPGMPSSAIPGPTIGNAPAGVPTNMPAQQPMPQPPQPQPQQPSGWQHAGTAASSSEISMADPGRTAYQQPAAGNRRLPVIIIAVVVLLLLAGITYFAFFRGSGNADNAAKQSSNSAAGKGIDIAALESATLEPPETIEGFTSRQTGTSAIKDYVAQDGNCELIVGTVTAAQLPGDNLEAIVKPQLDQLRQAGASVKGPNPGDALLVKDAVDGSKTYRMPTLNFEFSQDNKHAIVHYSAVIMKNGDRAVINRTCINKDGPVDQNKLKALDEVAKKVAIRPAAKP